MAKEKTDKEKKHPNVIARKEPYSIEAEQGLLCCLLNNPLVLENVMATSLNKDMFYSKANKHIFQAVSKLYEKKEAVDFATVTEQLDTDGTLKECGGAEYISTVSTLLANTANYEAYIKIIKKEAKLRELMNAANKILETCYSGDDNDKALVVAEELITQIAEEQGMSALKEFKEAVKEASEEIDKANRGQMPIGLKTGFDDLDKLLGGLGEGDLIVVGARPGQGKTSLGMNIALNVALAPVEPGESNQKGNQHVVAVFSLEMPQKQLAKRMISSLARVDFSALSKGKLGDDKAAWKDIVHAEAVINNSKMFIDDSSAITPVEILSKCRRLKREQGRLDLVVIDYLALMQTGKKIENRQQEVADMSRNIKLAAKDLKAPIILLSQLNREVDSGSGSSKEPKMSNLRESGAIEQDADIILFIHRPDEKDPKVKYKDKVNLIVAKHRNGEKGTIPLKWVGSEVSFRNAPPEYFEKNEENVVEITKEE